MTPDQPSDDCKLQSNDQKNTISKEKLTITYSEAKKIKGIINGFGKETHLTIKTTDHNWIEVFDNKSKKDHSWLSVCSGCVMISCFPISAFIRKKKWLIIKCHSATILEIDIEVTSDE